MNTMVFILSQQFSGDGKGVPVVVGRPVQRRHRVGTLFFCFCYFFDLSSLPLLDSKPKIPKY